MSSSFKQKKMKTLATRKKTRKRKMQQGMTYEDDSGRLFQPPSKRDPRWKKQNADRIITTVVKAAKKQKTIHKPLVLRPADDDEDDDEDEENDEIEIVSRELEDSDDNGNSDEDTAEQSEADDASVESVAPIKKTPIRFCSSIEDSAAHAAAKYKDIRRVDGRQKAKVLLMADTQSLYKAIKKSLGVKAEPVKSKSRFGVRSEKKNALVFRHIGALKTPMERFKDANKDVLKDYKCGKLPTLLTEDTSYYPYSDLSLQHLIFVAKSAASVINLDRSLLDEITLYTIVVNEKNSISKEDMVSLEQLYDIIDG